MKQKKSRKRIIFISVIALAICILSADQGSLTIAKSMAAIKKLNISRSSLKMKSGTQKKLTIKNAHKKVKWSSNNRKVAVIKSKTGKYENKAVIWAKTSGTCTITAKSGNAKGKCKIRVLKVSKDNTNPNSNTNADDTTAGIQFESVSVTKDSIAVTLKMYNNAKKPINYGLGCGIEKQIDGKWTFLETTEPQVIPAIACILEPGESHSETFRITKLKEPVTNGTYRITVPTMSKPEPPLLTTVINNATFQITDRS